MKSVTVQRQKQRARERRECPVHRYQRHGKEAEELRSGVEAIIGEFRGYPHAEVDMVCGVLQALLNRIDARDPLAYIERTAGRTL